MSSVALASMALVAGLTVVASPAQASVLDSPSAPLGQATVEPQVFSELAEAGTTDFWVYMSQQADVSAAATIADWDAQGWAVYNELTQTAAATQTELLALLDAEGVEYQSFWIVNAVKVTGSEELLKLIAALPGVEQITADRVYEIPEPDPAADEPGITAVEWGVDRINAPDVWSEFGATGEGIVVGSIDTGVQFNHPALVNQYRGNLGGGVFDHNYNWHDPSSICGSPSLAPCDNNGHGSHVTGTMVGDDGGDNQIGVAPDAQWISAKGCETTSCSEAALLSSGQFILAPTDLNNQNADPTRRPHIVNNSWGGGADTDPWYQPTVQAWVAAGIFPQFANGNTSFGTAPCGSSSNPGNLVESYAAGAFDINDNIAAFSNRGPSAWDSELIKPNISAPGVAVRSSVPTDSYGSSSGTSMASPHVAGAVALMWSAAEVLVRDIEQTRDLLDATAIDTGNLTCGGTAENNNVWGQGRLDVFAAVDASPRGPTGLLTGTVTDATTGDPIANATVTITGPADRERITGPDGGYEITLPIGDYDLTVNAFGYEEQTATVTIVQDATTTADFAMVAVDSVTISGEVTDGSGHGWELYARVQVEGTPAFTYTDPFTGAYSLSVPSGSTWDLVFTSEYPGYQAHTATVEVVDSDVDLDVQLLVDELDCRSAPGYEVDQPALAFVTSLPAQFVAYFNERGILVDFFTVAQLGQITGYDAVIWGYSATSVNETLFLNFLANMDAEGTGVVFLDHAFATWNGIKTLRNFTGNPAGGGTNTGGTGQENFYEVLVEHPILDGFDVGEQIIHEPGITGWLAWFDDYVGEGTQVLANVGRTTDGIFGSGIAVQQRPDNRHALLSIHSQSATRGPSDWSADSDQIFWNSVDWVIGAESSFECVPVEGGLVLGHVTDLNTGDGVVGATVTSGVNPDESGESAATPDDPANPDGFYWLFSSATGSVDFTASLSGYVDDTQTVDVVADAANQADFALAAGLLTVDPTSVEATVSFGGSAQREFTITNDGTAPADVRLLERPGDFELAGGGQVDDHATVAVLGDFNGLISTFLDGQGIPNHQIAWGDDISPYTVILVNRPGNPGQAVFLDFLDQTDASGTGVVFLDTWSTLGNGVWLLWQHVGNPSSRSVAFSSAIPHLFYEVTETHPILEGFSVGDQIVFDESDSDKDHAWFDGYTGDGREVVAMAGRSDTGVVGGGIGVQQRPTNRHALLSMHAASTFMEPDNWTVNGRQLLLNAVDWVSPDVPWLAFTPDTATLDPGESVSVTVTMDSSEQDQPGTLTAGIVVRHDTPYDVDPVDATLVIEPPNNWGKISGTLTGIDCNGSQMALVGAVVQINGRIEQVTLFTDGSGGYARWFPVSNNPLQLVVAANGFIPQATNAAIVPRQEVTQDFSLAPIC
jgi:subtilisin family serine protease